jgi:hypothetical protein
MAAPAKPPIKVCDELEGIPSHHVSRFQIIAAMTPASITTRLISMVWAVFATVSATPKPKTQYARKLKNAAQTTAWKGVSTFVATIVAIAFAAS